MNGAASFSEVIRLYFGETRFLALFLAAAAYVLWRSGRQTRRSALVTAAAALILVFNDAAYWLVGKVDDAQTYYRFLWMIPVVPMLAYVTVDVIVQQKSLLRKIAVLAAAVVIVWVSGVSYLEKGSFRRPQEVQYLHPEAAQICNLISEDKETPYPRVVCDFSLVLSLRLHDPTLRYAIRRDTYLSEEKREKKTMFWTRQKSLLKLVDGDELEQKRIRPILRHAGISYAIIANHHERDEQMKAAKCEIVGRTASYTVYRVR